MLVRLTANNLRLFSSDPEAEQTVVLNETKSSAMDLSTLSLNFSALSLLDKSLNLVTKLSTSQSNHSPEVTAGSNGLKARGTINDKSSSSSTSSSSDKSSLPIISLDEVAWHDTINDCWMVICDYVYDCTDFIKNHPGGQDVLLEYAGRDATLAFIGTGHSQGANRVLERYLIGELPFSERIFRTPNGIKIGDCV